MALRLRFVPGGEFVVNRELDFHGRVLKVGDALPWRDLGLHEWKVRELWIANMIDVKPAAVVAPTPAPQPQKRR